MRTLPLALLLAACAPTTTSGSADLASEDPETAAVPDALRPPPPFDLELTATALVVGEPGTLTVTGAEPGDEVYVVRGFGGLGTSDPYPGLDGRSLDILGPHKVFGPYVADVDGVAVVDIPASRIQVADTHHLQAVVRGGTATKLSAALEVRVKPVDRDMDGDGVDAYPWGTDVDDDGDGAVTWLVGGTDLDDGDGLVTLNGGTGVWGAPAFASTGVGSGPTGLDLGDFDNDGRLDLVTTHQNDDTTAVFPGLGDGTFGPDVRSTAGGGGDVVVGDFDEDGFLDYVALLEPTVFFGDGAFGFVAQPVDPLASWSVDELRVLDVDGDGHLDVAGHTYDAGAVVFLGDGAGGFTAVEVVAPGAKTAAFADLTGDGIVDVALGFFGPNEVQVWAGDGTGGFALANTVPTTDGVYFLGAGDFDGDGVDDLITSAFFFGVLEVYTNDGTGLWTRTDEQRPAAELERFAIVDVDADGDDDVLGTSQGGSTWLLESLGDGTFLAPVATGYSGFAFDLELGDVDGDGVLDQVVIDIAGGEYGVSLGQ